MPCNPKAFWKSFFAAISAAWATLYRSEKSSGVMSPLSLAVVSECLSFDMGQAFWPFPPPEKVAVAGNLCLCRSHHNSM